MARELSYADAVKLLGGTDSRVVAALDRLTGGLLLAATGGGSVLALNLFDAEGEFAKLSGELVTALADRMRGLGRFDRSERLAAAHRVIVIAAYFEALSAVGLPFDPSALAPTAADQVSLATGYAPDSPRLRAVAEILVECAVPGESPRLADDSGALVLGEFYGSISERLVRFVEEVPAWRLLDSGAAAGFRRAVREQVPRSAIAGYEVLLRRLAADFPEVAFWSSRQDHAALGEHLRTLSVGLAGLGRTLEAITAGTGPDERRRALTRRYRKALDRPIMEAGDVPDGLVIPTLDQSYVNPWYRAAFADRSAPVDREDWWDGHPVRADLEELLTAYLTSVRAADGPLIVLGQPGSGKSVLVKILAARLPPADFLTVRVALREVPADADLQTQIEHAIRAETGEQIDWPTLARTAGDAMPVILLDGFDELLQATGVGQTDYLEQIVRFQEREADQGRPVAVVVTSRTAVADRARIPQAGATVVKLEPFADAQIRHWLSIWNTSNADYLLARGTRRLPEDVVLRHRALSGQPLLLMMLALYDAADNALQKDDAGLEEADLYERLLVSFVEREVRKSRPELAGEPLAAAVETELLRLSVVAFSMFNRGRQWATEDELSADLAVLLGGPGTSRPVAGAGFREPATPAQIVVSRFFFIHQAQAIRDDRRLTTSEFLHSTFSEYLIARLTVHELTDLCRVTAVTTSRGRASASDGFLRAVLSFTTLTVRDQVVEFLSTQIRRLPNGDTARLRQLLLAAFHDAAEPATDRSYEDYRPARATASAMHAAYCANLLLLIVLSGGPVTGRELFPQARYVVRDWTSHALLWRSQLTIEGWRGLTSTLFLGRRWADGDREIVVGSTAPSDERLDGFWLSNIDPQDQPETGNVGWRKVAVEDLRRESHFTCYLGGDIAWHALEPVTRELDLGLGDEAWNEATTSFGRIGEDAAISVTHAMIRLWTTSSRQAGAGELEQVYRDCFTVIFSSRPDRDTANRDVYYARVLRQMAADHGRLSAGFRREVRDTYFRSLLREDHPENTVLLRSWAAEAFADLDDAGPGDGSGADPVYE